MENKYNRLIQLNKNQTITKISKFQIMVFKVQSTRP